MNELTPTEKCNYCDGVGVVPTGQTNEITCPKCNGARQIAKVLKPTDNDLKEIKQGLKEISEGKVVPLNRLKPTEGLRVKIAKKLFKIQYPDLDWGHSGTCDDSSWRRFEQKCLWDADQIISLLGGRIQEAVKKEREKLSSQIIFDKEDVHIFDTSYGYNQVRIDYVFINEDTELWQYLKGE